MNTIPVSSLLAWVDYDSRYVMVFESFDINDPKTVPAALVPGSQVALVLLVPLVYVCMYVKLISIG